MIFRQCQRDIGNHLRGRVVLEDSIVLLIESRQLIKTSAKSRDKDFVFAAFEHVIYIIAAQAVLFVTVTHNGSDASLPLLHLQSNTPDVVASQRLS